VAHALIDRRSLSVTFAMPALWPHPCQGHRSYSFGYSAMKDRDFRWVGMASDLVGRTGFEPVTSSVSGKRSPAELTAPIPRRDVTRGGSLPRDGESGGGMRHAGRGRLHWADILAGHVHALDPSTRARAAACPRHVRLHAGNNRPSAVPVRCLIGSGPDGLGRRYYRVLWNLTLCPRR
jgi:hypothetical protein